MKINKNIFGRLGLCALCATFGLLAFACLAPVNTDTANAADISHGVNAGISIKTKSALEVTLATEYAIEIIPGDSDKTFQKQTSNLKVATNNFTGYKVYLYTKNGKSSLSPKRSDNKSEISAVSSAVTSANFAPNTWGYSLTTSAVNDSTTYSAVPTTAEGESALVIDEPDASAADNYNLTFGAAVDLTLPSDTYSNDVVISVVANPAAGFNPDPVEFGGVEIAFMQDMTPEICANATVGETVQLYDARDAELTERPYWITKLDDGQCWMTQNLALDLSPDLTLTSEDTNLPEGTTYTPTIATFDNIATSTSEYLDYSWNFGNKVLTSPLSENYTNWESNFDSSTGTDGSTILTDVTGWEPTYDSNLATSTDRTVDVASQTYDAHYTLGNYYMFNAATANTAVTATSGEASGSICPKGWRLPTGNTGGQFYNLAVAAGADPDSYSDSDFALVKAPNYFVFGGFVNSDSTVGDAGYDGGYWSSTIGGSGYAYRLLFDVYGGLGAVDGDARYDGYSVRCIAE